MNTFVLSCSAVFSGTSDAGNDYTVYSVRLGSVVDGVYHTTCVQTFTKAKVGSSVDSLTKKVSKDGTKISYEILEGPSQAELDKLAKFDTDYSASNVMTLDLSEV